MRATYWTRWPDDTNGVLWVGLHWNERHGETCLVGLEVWTEPPGTARQSLGPEADAIDDVSPYPPTALRIEDVRGLRLADLVARFRGSLGPEHASVGASVARRGGRPRLYGPDHHALVAAIYRAAVAAGRADPTKATAEWFGVARSTANKWVARARAEGALEPASGGPDVAAGGQGEVP